MDDILQIVEENKPQSDHIMGLIRNYKDIEIEFRVDDKNETSLEIIYEKEIKESDLEWMHKFRQDNEVENELKFQNQLNNLHRNKDAKKIKKLQEQVEQLMLRVAALENKQ